MNAALVTEGQDCNLCWHCATVIWPKPEFVTIKFLQSLSNKKPFAAKPDLSSGERAECWGTEMFSWCLAHKGRVEEDATCCNPPICTKLILESYLNDEGKPFQSATTAWLWDLPIGEVKGIASRATHAFQQRLRYFSKHILVRGIGRCPLVIPTVIPDRFDFPLVLPGMLPNKYGISTY